MEEILKQILNKLDKLETIEEDIKTLKEGFSVVNSRVDSLENKVDKLEVKEQKHFELLMEEQNRIFLSLDGKLDKVLDRLTDHEVRISALEV